MDMKKDRSLASLILILLVIIIAASFYLPQIFDNSGTQTEINGNNSSENDPNLDDSQPSRLNLSDIYGVSTIDNESSYTIDASNVASKHERTLKDNSFRAVYDDGDTETTIRKFAQRVQLNDKGTQIEVEEYTNGIFKYQRVKLEDSEDNYESRKSDLSESRYIKSEEILSILNGHKLESIEDIRGGISVNMRSDENTTQISSFYGLNDVEESTAVVNISKKGYVKSFDVSMVTTSNFGFTQTEERSYELIELGGVNIEEPSWVELAESKTMLGSTELDKENNWIVLSHEGFSEVPKTSPEQKSSIRIETTSSSDKINLTQRIEKGDKVYVKPNTVRDWTISVNEEPVVPGSTNLDGDIALYVTKGDDVLFEKVISS